MYFVGHTRFSLYLPESRAWRATRDFANPSEYRDYLFSDERLSPRADVFFNLSLPLLDQARKDHQYRHILSFSDELPAKYQLKVEEAAERYTWLILDRHVAGIGAHNADRVARNLMRGRGENEGVYGTFRLDDDDLLPLNYFDRMDRLMGKFSVGMYVSLGAGITAIQQCGKFWNARKVVQRMFSAGLMSVSRLNADTTVTRPLNYLSHHLADERAPVIVDSREPGFFWTRTILQDTSFSRDKMDYERLNLELRHLPVAEKSLDVLPYFPVLSDTLEGGPAPTSQ